MSPPFRVALLGLRAAERQLVVAALRETAAHSALERAGRTYIRDQRFEIAHMLSDADFFVADAEDGPSERLVRATERLDDTVFVGGRVPEGAVAWLPRPLDPAHVLRALSKLAVRRGRRAGLAPGQAKAQAAAATPVPGPAPVPAWLATEAASAATTAEPAAIGPTITATATASTTTSTATFGPVDPLSCLEIVIDDPGPSAAGDGPFELDLRLPPIDVGALAPAERPAAVPGPDAAAAGGPVASGRGHDADGPADRRTEVDDDRGADLDLEHHLERHRERNLDGDLEGDFASGLDVIIDPDPDPDADPDLAEQAEPSPVDAPPAPALAPASAPPAAPTAAPAPPGPRALIVDDSAVALRFLQTQLWRLGLHSDLADNSGDALALLARRDYDVILLDMELGPGSDLDGLALARRVKAATATRVPPAPLLMVSAHHGEMARVRATLAGCDALLPKPLAPAELQRLLLRHGVLLRVPR